MINKIFLIGNVGAEPEYRALDNGTQTATIRVATTEKFKNPDGSTRKQTEWHTVTAWRNLADIVDRFIHKGDKVYVEGSLHYRTYTDKDGIERTMATITAKEIKSLTPNKVEAPATSWPTSCQSPMPQHDDDYLPL